jgi:hypothetical protein
MNLDRIYRPLLEHFRRSRIARFYAEMSVNSATQVLDIGGSPFVWDLAEKLGFPRPKVTIVNLLPPSSQRAADFPWVVGNAVCLPFRNQSFDVALSNSVVEHLGSWEMQKRFASEVLRVSKRHFVQTPNQGFFFEPHLLTPFVHWLPLGWRCRVARRGTVWGLLMNPSPESAGRMVRGIRLLRQRDLKNLFPNDRLLLERFLWMPKSLVTFDRPSGVAARHTSAISHLARTLP